MKRHLLLLPLALLAPAASAGPFTDDLARCLVSQTTAGDRTNLVRWLFAAISKHPAVATMSSVSDPDIERSTADVGALMMRLLTDSCRDRAKSAIKYEGPAAIQLSFQVLGQAAAAETFSNPEVAKVMAGLQKHADSKKLEALTQE